jgi:hypothetical protein
MKIVRSRAGVDQHRLSVMIVEVFDTARVRVECFCDASVPLDARRPNPAEEGSSEWPRPAKCYMMVELKAGAGQLVTVATGEKSGPTVNGMTEMLAPKCLGLRQRNSGDANGNCRPRVTLQPDSKTQTLSPGFKRWAFAIFPKLDRKNPASMLQVWNEAMVCPLHLTLEAGRLKVPVGRITLGPQK